MAVPGTPRLLRAINDRAALELLLDRGPLSRTELGALTGLSKPTASHLLSRLREAGLVVLQGRMTGGRGPSAELYAINPAIGHVAALDVTPARIHAAVADISGTVVGTHRLDTPGRAGGDVVARVRAAVDGASAEAGLDWSCLRYLVIGTPGALNPETGRLAYAFHLPGWHRSGLVADLRDQLGVDLAIENDVNLTAVAEQRLGVARQATSFVQLWVSEGVGMAVVIDVRLHRGASGGAGEVGYMPVPGAPLMHDVARTNTGGFQSLTGGPAVASLFARHGFRGGAVTAVGKAAAAAIDDTHRGTTRARAALDELADRLAVGLAATTAVLDPELIVLGGDVLLAGGEPLRDRVERKLHRLTVTRPPVRVTEVAGNAVLAGAIRLALTSARTEVLRLHSP